TEELKRLHHAVTADLFNPVNEKHTEQHATAHSPRPCLCGDSGLRADQSIRSICLTRTYAPPREPASGSRTGRAKCHGDFGSQGEGGGEGHYEPFRRPQGCGP